MTNEGCRKGDVKLKYSITIGWAFSSILFEYSSNTYSSSKHLRQFVVSMIMSLLGMKSENHSKKRTHL